MRLSVSFMIFFFFNDTATTEIYTLSLHDALPISVPWREPAPIEIRNLRIAYSSAFPESITQDEIRAAVEDMARELTRQGATRSEEHTSELQSRQYLVCRLLLEKKKKTTTPLYIHF